MASVGFGIGINYQKRRAGGGGGGGDGNVLNGVWIQGTNTVMSFVGDRVRATASGGNPRVYQHVTGLTIGVTYVFVGTVYYGTSTGAFTIFRVDDEPDLPDANYFQDFIDSGEGSVTYDGTTGTGSFVASSTEAYIGIVAVVGGDGEYSEITNNFIMRDEDFVPGPAEPVRWYIDSVNGSNANDGKSEGTAKQTISSIAGTLTDRARIYLARGSYWREQLSLNGYDQVIVAPFGTGQKPTFDAADVIPNANFVVDGTFGNCYNVTLTTPTDTALYLSMWEDGVRPKYVTSKALCQATAGTWTMGTTNGDTDGTGSQVFTIHPLGSTNPTTDGKVYEYSRRLYGCVTGTRAIVHDIRTKRQVHNNGSFVGAASTKAYDCIFEDGVKHNAYFSQGSVADGCIVWKCDWASRDNWTGIVNFEVSATNQQNQNINCVSRVGLEYRDYAMDNSRGLTAFYSHTAGGVGDNWATILYSGCSSYGADTGFSVSDVNNLEIDFCYVEGGVVPFVTSGVQNTITDPAAKSPDGAHNLQRFINSQGTANTTIDGARVYATTTNDALVYDVADTGALSIGNSVFYLDSPASFGNIIKTTGDKTVNISGCVLVGIQPTADISALFIDTPGNISNNGYCGSASLDYTIAGVEYTDYAAFTAAHPELTLNSFVQIDPGFVDPENLDFNYTDPTTNPLAMSFMGLLRPNTAYTPIPSDAEIEAM